MDEELERLRLEAPSRVANAWRNADAGARRARWEPARDALWDFISPWIEDGARIGIVGAGNGDDLPLRRIARRAGSVVLIDIDPRAARGARRRVGRRLRRRVEAIGHDVTEGAADRIVLAARERSEPIPGDQSSRPPAAGRDAIPAPDELVPTPLPGAPFDLVIGDLLYSQLLYPALLDLGVAEERRAATLAEHEPPLTRAVVARLHASAPRVVHVHDPIAWWDGHEQPFALEDVLSPARAGDAEAALALVARGNGPTESDPRAALADLGLAPAATALWHWPFAPGVDYLACATMASAQGTGSKRSSRPSLAAAPSANRSRPRPGSSVSVYSSQTIEM